MDVGRSLKLSFMKNIKGGDTIGFIVDILFCSFLKSGQGVRAAFIKYGDVM